MSSLSVEVTGPATPVPVLPAETVSMRLGRLEIFIVFVALRKLITDGTAVLRGKGISVRRVRTLVPERSDL